MANSLLRNVKQELSHRDYHPVRPVLHWSPSSSPCVASNCSIEGRTTLPCVIEQAAQGPCEFASAGSDVMSGDGPAIPRTCSIDCEATCEDIVNAGTGILDCPVPGDTSML